MIEVELQGATQGVALRAATDVSFVVVQTRSHKLHRLEFLRRAQSAVDCRDAECVSP